MREKTPRTITVEHPEHGGYTAVGVKDKLQAVQDAARVWKRPWSKIAKECTFTEEKGGEDDVVERSG